MPNSAALTPAATSILSALRDATQPVLQITYDRPAREELLRAGLARRNGSYIELTEAGRVAPTTLGLNDIACRENAKLVADETLYEIAQLDVRTVRARNAGLFDVATAYESLSEALRSGQLTLSRYLTSSTWGAVFGGRCLA